MGVVNCFVKIKGPRTRKQKPDTCNCIHGFTKQIESYLKIGFIPKFTLNTIALCSYSFYTLGIDACTCMCTYTHEYHCHNKIYEKSL